MVSCFEHALATNTHFSPQALPAAPPGNPSRDPSKPASSRSRTSPCSPVEHERQRNNANAAVGRHARDCRFQEHLPPTITHDSSCQLLYAGKKGGRQAVLIHRTLERHFAYIHVPRATYFQQHVDRFSLCIGPLSS